MPKNAGSVHGTIGKALQQIEGDIAANSQPKTPRIRVVCVMNFTIHSTTETSLISLLFQVCFALKLVTYSTFMMIYHFPISMPPDWQLNFTEVATLSRLYSCNEPFNVWLLILISEISTQRRLSRHVP